MVGQKKRLKTTSRNNCDSWCRKHLDTRKCHSPNLPHQHMFLDSRRRCRSQILGGHNPFLICFAQTLTVAPKNTCCTLSLYPIQEPIGKEQLPGGGHWKRGSCARACTSVHLMKPPVRRAAILGLPESCPGAKKQRVPKKIDWTFPGFVFGIVDRSCISHDFQASKCQSCMILSGDSVKTQRPEASKTSVKSA